MVKEGLSTGLRNADKEYTHLLKKKEKKPHIFIFCPPPMQPLLNLSHSSIPRDSQGKKAIPSTVSSSLHPSALPWLFSASLCPQKGSKMIRHDKRTQIIEFKSVS